LKVVRILFFASLREVLQCSELRLTTEGPCTLTALQLRIGQKLHGADEIFRENKILCAINQIMVNTESDIVVEDDDEVAFFPPVTGG
jgi:sulfur-carrier protein